MAPVSTRTAAPRPAAADGGRMRGARRPLRRGRAFRSRVVMARHGFGRGEYKYFAYPLPDLVAALRTALYPRLAEIANRWNEAMGIAVRFPPDHADFLEALPRGRPDAADAAAAAIRRRRLQLPAPGPLRRARVPAAGDLLLSEPGADFTGGEFVLTEQRPRMQSRAEVVPLRAGRRRDLPGAPPAGAGHARHLSRQHAPRRQPRALGQRHTLGVIFHDAK